MPFINTNINTSVIEFLASLKRLENMRPNYFKILFATLVALLWVAIISIPFEASPIYSLWTVIYFFPFYFSLLILMILIAMNKKYILLQIIFSNSFGMFINSIILLSFLLLTWLHIINYSTLVSLLVNCFCFTFSIYFYFSLVKQRND
jgi:hypothetical protein